MGDHRHAACAERCEQQRRVARILKTVNRAEIGARPIDAATLEGQQKIANVFANLKLIPKPLRVTEAAWQVGQ